MTNPTIPPAAPAIPHWLRSFVAITVFSGILATIVYGTRFFQGDSRASSAGQEQPLPADQRMAIASASGDWPGTEQACRELIAEDPFDGRAIFNLGRSLHGQGRLDEAAEQFRQAREFTEYRLESLYCLACIDAVQHRPDAAIDKLRTVIRDGFWTRQGISFERSLALLRDDPEFQRLVLVESFNRDEQSFQNVR